MRRRLPALTTRGAGDGPSLAAAADAVGRVGRRLRPRPACPSGAKALISALLPGKAHPIPRLPRAELVLTPSTLPDARPRRARGGRRRAERDARDDGARALHLGGKSTPDLLARRSREPQRAPDAVVSPASHAEVLAVLAACDDPRHRRRAVRRRHERRRRRRSGCRGPRRTSSRSTSPAPPACIAFDERVAARHLRRRHHRPAGRGAARAPSGCTLGHFPQSYEFATIGGYAATRSSGQASRGYGRFDDLVHAPARRHPDRRARARPGARERGGARPARTLPRLGGRLRRADGGHRPGPPRSRARPPTARGPSPTSRRAPQRSARPRSAASAPPCCASATPPRRA